MNALLAGFFELMAHESLLIGCWRDGLSKNGDYINPIGRMS
jgi:hypothetical protein